MTTFPDGCQAQCHTLPVCPSKTASGFILAEIFRTGDINDLV